MDNSKARCSAFDKAVNLLAFKDRTTQEIRKRLDEKGYSSEEIEDAVDKLSYYGYLNDQSYTISYIRSNTSKKGKKLIYNELNQKGIDKTIVEEVCDEIEIDEISTIDQIINRRFSGVDFNEEKEYRRVYNFFLRRGFSYENINRVLRKYKKSSFDTYDYEMS